MTNSESLHTITTGERISVQIKKSLAPYSAVASDLTGSAWLPKPENNGTLSAQGGFNAPSTAGTVVSFSVLFDFIPDPDSANDTTDVYVVLVTGANGISFYERIIGPGHAYRTRSMLLVQCCLRERRPNQ